MPEDQRKNSNNWIFKSNLTLSKTYLASLIGQQKLWIKLQVLNLRGLALQHSFSSFLPESRQLDFIFYFFKQRTMTVSRINNLVLQSVSLEQNNGQKNF